MYFFLCLLIFLYLDNLLSPLRTNVPEYYDDDGNFYQLIDKNNKYIDGVRNYEIYPMKMGKLRSLHGKVTTKGVCMIKL